MWLRINSSLVGAMLLRCFDTSFAFGIMISIMLFNVSGSLVFTFPLPCPFGFRWQGLFFHHDRVFPRCKFLLADCALNE